MTSMRRWLEPVDHSWHPRGACFGLDADGAALFDSCGEKEPESWARARAETAIDEFCMNCPVMMKCAEERERHEYWGVWGGELGEKRGIVDVQTGLLIRKWASAQTSDESSEEYESELDLAPDPEPVFEWEADVFLTRRGVEQFAMPLAMAT